MSDPTPTTAPSRRLLRRLSDADLAERCAAGDDGACAVLYERLRPNVIAVCASVLGRGADAEDAAQEAFVALFRALRSAPPRELRPWLARVSRNAAIDVGRRRTRGCTGDGEHGEPAVDPSPGKLELDSLVEDIRELPASQRSALLMRELAGHSYADISAMLEVEQGVVRGLIARARATLRCERQAAEMACADARANLAADDHHRGSDRVVRRHVRGCVSCQHYRQALLVGPRGWRAIAGIPAGGTTSGGILGGLAAKGAVLTGALTQATAACAVTACAVGGVVLLSPHSTRRPGAVRVVNHSLAGSPGRSAVSATGSSPSGAAHTVRRGGGGATVSSAARVAGGPGASTGAAGVPQPVSERAAAAGVPAVGQPAVGGYAAGSASGQGRSPTYQAPGLLGGSPAASGGSGGWSGDRPAGQATGSGGGRSGAPAGGGGPPASSPGGGPSGGGPSGGGREAAPDSRAGSACRTGSPGGGSPGGGSTGGGSPGGGRGG